MAVVTASLQIGIISEWKSTPFAVCVSASLETVAVALGAGLPFGILFALTASTKYALSALDKALKEPK